MSERVGLAMGVVCLITFAVYYVLCLGLFVLVNCLLAFGVGLFVCLVWYWWCLCLFCCVLFCWICLREVFCYGLI